MSMIESELVKLGYELWQPVLGGAGVCAHTVKPDLFTASSTAPATPHSVHSSQPHTQRSQSKRNASGS